MSKVAKEKNINTLEKARFTNQKGRGDVAKVSLDEDNGKLGTVQTILTTVPTKINTPKKASSFNIFHQTEDAGFYIGDKNVDNTAPVVTDVDVIEATGMKTDNRNSIYGFVSSGTLTVFAIGVHQ